ncbi:MAG: TatD family hydrolase [Chloroflexota bacterium]|nr:TatD family hydrolase [Chloroflexota bacterium]
MLIDAHTHLDMYGDDLDAALREIREHRILTFTNSMDPASWERNVEIGQACELVVPCFGIHPWNAAGYVDRLAGLREPIERCPVLGEIGLDHYFIEDASVYPAQQQVFEHFLAAAREQGKLVNLHTKGAEREVFDLLRRHRIERAIVHWYSGPLDVLADLISTGAYFTVGAELLDSEHIRAVARMVPLERLLSETDNPGGSRSLGGRPRMPLVVRDVVNALADVRGVTHEDMVRTVHDNFRGLIAGDPWLSDTYSAFFAEPMLGG